MGGRRALGRWLGGLRARLWFALRSGVRRGLRLWRGTGRGLRLRGWALFGPVQRMLLGRGALLLLRHGMLLLWSGAFGARGARLGLWPFLRGGTLLRLRNSPFRLLRGALLRSGDVSRRRRRRNRAHIAVGDYGVIFNHVGGTTVVDGCELLAVRAGGLGDLNLRVHGRGVGFAQSG